MTNLYILDERIMPHTSTSTTEFTLGNVTKRFVLAGNAVFTATSVTGAHYTFKVKRVDPREGSYYKTAAYFVSLLTGSSNMSDFTYMGQLAPNTGEVRLTKKSNYTKDSTPFKVVNYVFGLLWREMPLPAGYDLQHEGKCGRCGRRLTHPESITSGIGPECSGKI